MYVYNINSKKNHKYFNFFLTLVHFFTKTPPF